MSSGRPNQKKIRNLNKAYSNLFRICKVNIPKIHFLLDRIFLCLKRSGPVVKTYKVNSLTKEMVPSDYEGGIFLFNPNDKKIIERVVNLDSFGSKFTGCKDIIIGTENETRLVVRVRKENGIFYKLCVHGNERKYIITNTHLMGITRRIKKYARLIGVEYVKI